MKEELEKFGILEENVSISLLTTMKIGGRAKYLIHPRTVEDVKELMFYIQKENIPYFVLGNGSNVLFSDEPFDGVIIKLDAFTKIEKIDNHVLYAESGVFLPKLALYATNTNLIGFEWASGIPGTVGGSIINNAGCYQKEMFDDLISVTILTKEGEIKTIEKEKIKHEYRNTQWKGNQDCIILSCLLNLKQGNKKESLALIEDRRKRRMASQPLNYPSAGSVFQNPSNDLPSWKLIQKVGLQGFSINDAKVSEKHANFIINKGNATGKDVRDLIQLIQKKVFEETGIWLKEEQEYVNWEK